MEDDPNVWKSSAKMAQQMKSCHEMPLMRNIKGSTGYVRIASRLSRAEVYTLGATSAMTDEQLLAIKGMTAEDVRVIRTACFYISGKGSREMVEHESQHIAHNIDLLRRQQKVIEQRIELLEERLAKLTVQSRKYR